MNEAAAHRSQGIRALLSGSLTLAQRSLTRAVELAPYDPVARHNLALVARLRGAPSLAYKQAASAMNLGHEINSVRATIAAQHALHARIVGRDAEAITSLDRALDADDRHAVSWYYRGLFARLDGAIDQAIAHFERALSAGSTPLPPLVRSRIAGMLADARALDADRSSPVRAASMIAAISEPILSDLAPAPLDLDVTGEAFAERGVREAECGREITVGAAAQALHEARSITVLTGAGCSSASGLSTRKELWQRFDKDTVVTATHNDLRALWLVVLDFLGGKRPLPNAAHDAIAALPRVRAIVTQNVDELHQRARREGAAPAVIELHGTLERLRCASCGAIDPRTSHEVVESEAHGLPPRCARCKTPTVRPDVVLFGEWVDADELASAVCAVQESDVLLVVGCAMDVAPASELPRLAIEAGATVIEVKRTPSRLSRSIATSLVRGSAERVLPAIYQALSTMESLPALPEARLPEAPTPVVWRARAASLGENVSSASVAERTVSEGTLVRAGQPIALLECDKATVDIDAPIDGTLVRFDLPLGVEARADAAIATIAPSPELEVARIVRAPKSRAVLDARDTGVDPIVLSFGAHTPALRALFELVSNARWLQPDTALATMHPESQSWLNDRIDEVRAALGLDETSLPLWLSRDAHECFARSRSAWTEAQWLAISLRKSGVPPWIDALDTAGFELVARDATEHSLSIAAATAVTAACHTARPWTGSALDPAPAHLLTLAGLCAQHIARHGAASPRATAFRPLLALWLRGAWPFALPDAIGLWVPLFEDGAITPNPTGNSLTDRARWPEHPRGNTPCPRPVGGGLSALWSAPRAR